MPLIENKYRTEIDFRPTRGHEESDIIYTALIHHRSAGNSRSHASGLIVRAYKLYDPSEPVMVTKMKDHDNRNFFFCQKYDIKRTDDIINAIRTKATDLEVTISEPHKMFVSFPADEPEAADLIEKLSMIRYRDRGIVIFRFLYQYFANGNDDYYMNLCSDYLLRWMKNEYVTAGNKVSDKLSDVIKIIMKSVREFSDDTEIEEEKTAPDNGGEDEKEEELSRADQLRRMIGLV